FLGDLRETIADPQPLLRGRRAGLDFRDVRNAVLPLGELHADVRTEPLWQRFIRNILSAFAGQAHEEKHHRQKQNGEAGRVPAVVVIVPGAVRVAVVMVMVVSAGAVRMGVVVGRGTVRMRMIVVMVARFVAMIVVARFMAMRMIVVVATA